MVADGALGADKPRDWVGRQICRISKGPVSHIKQYLLGCTFERTLWWVGYWWKSGIRVTAGAVPADYYGRPKVKFADHQLKSMLSYWLCELNERTPYNIPKLLALGIVIPNRPFFEKLGWVPFQAHGLGDLCSTTVDKVLRHAGLDALPELSSDQASPADFLKSPLFDWEVV